MKVLFLLHETGEHSGAWKSAFSLLKGFKNNHVDCLVLTPDKKEVYNILVKEGFSVKPIKIVWCYRKKNQGIWYRIIQIPFSIRRKFLSVIWFIRVSRLVKKYNPDIIHSNSSVFYLGYDLAKHFNIPHVWHIREYGDLDFNLDTRKTQKRLNEHISYNICIAKCIQHYRGLDDDPRTTVIYNGILSERDIRYIAPKDKYFLYVGSLGEGKGIRDIINAWIVFKTNNQNLDYSLKIVGGYDYEIKKWWKYIREVSECDTLIEFMGMRNDVGEIMSHAKALIVASYSEAFGRVTAEGMFNGTIVIGRDSAGTKEQFDNGLRIIGEEIGIRFTDVETLVKAMAVITKMDEQEYRNYVSKAQTVVKKMYSSEACVNNVLRLYHDICANRKVES